MTRSFDLSNCDREPIHVPGSVQPFGFLLALLSDFSICIASDNVAAFLGLETSDLMGRPLSEAICEPAIKAIRTRIDHLTGNDAVERMFGLQLQPNGKPFDLAPYAKGNVARFTLDP